MSWPRCGTPAPRWKRPAPTDTAQEQKLAECRENPMLQQLYKEDEAREAAWDAARAAVETTGGDIRVCEKQLASCEAEQTKAEEDRRGRQRTPLTGSSPSTRFWSRWHGSASRP